MPVGIFRNADGLQRLPDDLLLCSSGTLEPPEPPEGSLSDDVPHRRRVIPVDVSGLRHVPDAATHLVEGLPKDLDGSGEGGDESENGLHEGGLTSPIGAKEGQGLTCGQAEAGVGQSDVVLICDGEVVNLEGCWFG